jgi:hypothetical protein
MSILGRCTVGKVHRWEGAPLGRCTVGKMHRWEGAPLGRCTVEPETLRRAGCCRQFLVQGTTHEAEREYAGPIAQSYSILSSPTLVSQLRCRSLWSAVRGGTARAIC